MSDFSSTSVRLDKWLWAVRVYKTRTLAAAACRAGHVKIGGQNVKPARELRVSELIVARVGVITRTVRVLALTERRVGPKLVGRYLEELTPPEEFAKRREPKLPPVFWRPKGLGRPTKKERRAIKDIFGGQ